MSNPFCRRSAGVPAVRVLWLAGLLSGCAAPAVVHKDPAMGDWSRTEAPASRPEPAFAQAKAPEKAPAVRKTSPAKTEADPAQEAGPLQVPPAELPPAVASRPIEAATVGPAGFQRDLPVDIISELALNDEADVATILRALAKAANVSMLVSPQVTGQVRFTFKDVPWDQAFRSVVNSAGLTYSWDGDVLRVMTIDDVKRIVEMEKLLKEREGVKVEKQQSEPLIVQVIPVKYSKAQTIGTTVKTLLTAPPAPGGPAAGVPVSRASISVDEENNALIVHAIPEDVRKVMALVQQLDRPKLQVHIEARIVEASRDTARQLGVQWGGGSAQISQGHMIRVGGQGITSAGYNSDFAAQFAQGAGSAAPPPVGFSLGMLSEKIGASELLYAQLTALQSKGRIQILASPSITTLDNESAIIESGEERAYQKSSDTGVGVDIEWKKAVLKLEVTPHVVDEDYLRVDIIANKDSFDETKPEVNGEFPVNTKHAETAVLLRNGDTVVIGGLSIESDSDTQAGIPWLMNIPGLGVLFKNRAQSRQFNETLIFITPEIIAKKK